MSINIVNDRKRERKKEKDYPRNSNQFCSSVAAIPDYPIQKKRRPEAEALKVDDQRKRPIYVPVWLPSFPDAHTYADTAVRGK
jgi:hypothetical protein